MNNLEQVRHILVIEDPIFRRTISLDGATYSIGRHSSNDIVLSCQKTSRHHATLLRRTDVKTNDHAYWILDGDLQGNRSRNGIYINGKKCLVHELKHGDLIKFSGDARAKYQIVSGVKENINHDDVLSYGVTSKAAPKVDHKQMEFSKETLVAPEEKLKQNAYLAQSVTSNSFEELSPQPIVEIDLYGKVTYINSTAIVDFKDIERQQLNHPVLENLISHCHNQNGNPLVREVEVDGKVFRQNAYYIPSNKVIRSYFFDISQQKLLEKQLQDREELKQSIFQELTEGIIIVNEATKKIVEVNNVGSELLGYSLKEILEMTIYDLSFEADKLAITLQKIIEDRIIFKGQGLWRHQNGSIVNLNLKITFISSEEAAKFCIIIYPAAKPSDFSSDLLAINSSKRDIFYEQLQSAIANAQRNQTLLAVVFFRIDFFPNIQETIGYEKSERLLTGLAQRLEYSLRSGDIVTHWQEDKFALLLSQIGGIEEVAKIIQRIQNSLEQSFKIGDAQFSIQTNMGIAVYPYDGKDCNTLLKNAGLALHRTQNSDRSNNYQFYNSTNLR